MAVIAAWNLVDGLVLIEDGRELPITQFYASGPGEPPLTAKSELRAEHRIPDYVGAEVFTVEVPGADAALIVELAAVTQARAKDIN